MRANDFLGFGVMFLQIGIALTFPLVRNYLVRQEKRGRQMPALSEPLTSEEVLALEQVRHRRKEMRLVLGGSLSLPSETFSGSVSLVDELNGALSEVKK